MNVIESTRSTNRIAVFIDFDNVEIGVKSTIGGQFDIGLVLEAIKERGEIVTKIAYSDWKRAGDYSRLLTQHAIRMVQRNLTPGGDKNGADITMALDALEMAFTHDHINTFVIVGGDSDFISLVEKLKQYGRKVIVVGGRQFTSATMQRNCHEFIAYENLVGRGSGRPAERGGRPSAAPAASEIAKVLPLVKRALKVLSEREVAPQLGLLKSTLLQLDSTFSEREYGAGSFRDFMEKVARTGAVTLKNAGRSMLVESRETDGDVVVHAERQERPLAEQASPTQAHEPLEHHEVQEPRERHERAERPERPERHEPREAVDADAGEEETLPSSPMSAQDGIRAVHQAFSQSATPLRWPMYVRQAKQYLRSAVEGFDERKYGFASVVDLLRAAGKEGVLRIERDRQGAVRIFPGAQLVGKQGTPAIEPVHHTRGGERSEERSDETSIDAIVERVDAERAVAAEAVNEPPIVDADIDIDADEASGEPNFNVDGANVSRPIIAAAPRRNARGRRAPAPKVVKAAAAAPKAKTAKPPARARKTKRGKPTAADNS
jgi:uncharacterized protein (TIGR00288 family)